ncbi:unknown [Tannerella sp. CAG:118]|uniref:Uncharacterized protein n=1 Tax=Coprobacter secundus subsp. similis TaxID=2751153 RepID=A0A7G1HRH9_9BACT|nr:hypothetical protein Cop2CBH44_06680 [Coprobacter secundus subsp. similis]CCY35890.1 unknown [Tannerella sp. CAG:118]
MLLFVKKISDRKFFLSDIFLYHLTNVTLNGCCIAAAASSR